MLGNKFLEKVDFRFTHVHFSHILSTVTRKPLAPRVALVDASREMQICNLRNGALLTFWIKLFVQKSTLHRVVYKKSVKECEEISQLHSVIVFEKLVSQNTDFR